MDIYEVPDTNDFDYRCRLEGLTMARFAYQF